MPCFTSKNEVAEYVDEMLGFLKSDCPWIMTIEQVPSEGFSVQIAIDTSSVDTKNQKAWPYLEQLQSI